MCWRLEAYVSERRQQGKTNLHGQHHRSLVGRNPSSCHLQPLL